MPDLLPVNGVGTGQTLTTRIAGPTFSTVVGLSPRAPAASAPMVPLLLPPHHRFATGVKNRKQYGFSMQFAFKQRRLVRWARQLSLRGGLFVTDQHHKYAPRVSSRDPLTTRSQYSMLQFQDPLACRCDRCHSRIYLAWLDSPDSVQVMKDVVLCAIRMPRAWLVEIAEHADAVHAKDCR